MEQFERIRRDVRGQRCARCRIGELDSRPLLQCMGNFGRIHTRRAFDHDRARGNDILALGWSVLRVTSKHLETNPERVTTWVRRALRR